MCDIEVGNFVYSQDENGSWIYKSKNTTALVKSNIKYKDEPQFNVIKSFEENEKVDYKNILKDTLSQISIYLKSL